MARAAVEMVVAVVADQPVVAVAPEQRVPPLGAVQRVVAHAALQQVVVPPAVQAVVTQLAQQRVGAVAALQRVVALAAVEQVVSAATLQRIVVRPPANDAAVLVRGDMVDPRAAQDRGFGHADIVEHHAVLAEIQRLGHIVRIDEDGTGGFGTEPIGRRDRDRNRALFEVERLPFGEGQAPVGLHDEARIVDRPGQPVARIGIVGEELAQRRPCGILLDGQSGKGDFAGRAVQGFLDRDLAIGEPQGIDRDQIVRSVRAAVAHVPDPDAPILAAGDIVVAPRPAVDGLVVPRTAFDPIVAVSAFDDGAFRAMSDDGVVAVTAGNGQFPDARIGERRSAIGESDMLGDVVDVDREALRRGGSIVGDRRDLDDVGLLGLRIERAGDGHDPGHGIDLEASARILREDVGHGSGIALSHDRNQNSDGCAGLGALEDGVLRVVGVGDVGDVENAGGILLDNRAASGRIGRIVCARRLVGRVRTTDLVIVDRCLAFGRCRRDLFARRLVGDVRTTGIVLGGCVARGFVGRYGILPDVRILLRKVGQGGVLGRGRLRRRVRIRVSGEPAVAARSRVAARGDLVAVARRGLAKMVRPRTRMIRVDRFRRRCDRDIERRSRRQVRRGGPRLGLIQRYLVRLPFDGRSIDRCHGRRGRGDRPHPVAGARQLRPLARERDVIVGFADASEDGPRHGAAGHRPAGLDRCGRSVGVRSEAGLRDIELGVPPGGALRTVITSEKVLERLDDCHAHLRKNLCPRCSASAGREKCLRTGSTVP